jgi:Leucine-rich repeat (LRR) protein
LKLHNVQLSSCKLKQIEDDAFVGQSDHLKNLNLQDNLLEQVPIRALSHLQKLNLLDLSKNKISLIPNDAFKSLSNLATLKLMDNNVTLERYAFRGLDICLKNLNLKGTKQKRIPDAVRGLKTLAFLDLSQNGIRELPGIGGIRTFEGLDSLTALNLERNLIQSLGETAFQGTRKTLSSLSLLNNLLSDFPVGAVHSLKELRVLDIGFNLLTSLPETAFRGNPSVTLLALDGNPLPTVPVEAFAHLNKTLRGLSLGGRFLHCDCKLKWVAEWIRNGDLQVTSRERNPQFCGTPNRFRDRGFYSIQPEELTCSDSEIGAADGPIGVVDSLVPKPFSAAPTPSSTTLFVTPSTIPASSASTNHYVSRPSGRPQASTSTHSPSASPSQNISVSTSAVETTTAQLSTLSALNQTTSKQASTTTKAPSRNSNTWRQNSNQQQHKQRPPLVLGYPPQRGQQIDDSKEVQVKNAYG